VSVPWSWGSRITDQLIWDGLCSVEHLFEGSLLDLGCGMKPYKGLLGTRVRRWVGLDFASTPSGRSAATVFGSALELPFGQGTFDTILSTQVLEHVPRPEDLMREAYRVLRCGGYLVLTAPQTGPLHEEPNDFFRYTCHGLRYMAEQTGFRVIRIKPLGGAIATVCQMIVWHLNWLRRTPPIGAALHSGTSMGVAWLALGLDHPSWRYGGGAMKDTLNWLVVATKSPRW
jgi:SAM-dependent methyltransferase